MKSFLILSSLLAGVALSAPISARNETNSTTPSQCADYCAGTKYNASLAGDYICGDSRLGPVTLPTQYPLPGIIGNESTYNRFGDLCPGEFLTKYTFPENGSYKYPDYQGFLLDTSGKPILANITITPGTLLDRFGSEFGTFMSPIGVPYAQRSLPPTNLNAPVNSTFPANYHVYQVVQSFQVLAGPTAPWFEQMGLSLQFVVPLPVKDLVSGGFIVPVAKVEQDDL